MSEHRKTVLGAVLAAACALAAVSLPAASDDGKAAMAKAEAPYQAGEWAKAAEAYEGIVKADEKNGEAWFRLGFSLYSMGKFDEALAAYGKAEALGTAPLRLLASAGASHAKLGHTDKAFEYLGKAVDAGLPPSRLDANPNLDPIRSDKRFKDLHDKAEKSVYPCKFEAESQQFNFWIGEWDVFSNGTKQGDSRIEALKDGCLIVENYTNTAGYAGKSLNFYDPEAHKWQQLWVDNSGGIIRYSGNFTDGAMRFTEGVHSQRGGKTVMSRMTFTPNADGSVRQFIEESSDEGKTWSVWFDGKYVRKK